MFTFLAHPVLKIQSILPVVRLEDLRSVPLATETVRSESGCYAEHYTSSNVYQLMLLRLQQLCLISSRLSAPAPTQQYKITRLFNNRTPWAGQLQQNYISYDYNKI